MADWSLLECDYYNRYDAYPYNYYQEKELQPVPAKCLPAQTQPYCSPSPTLTLLLSPSSPAQPPPPPCVYKPPIPKGSFCCCELPKTGGFLLHHNNSPPPPRSK